MQQRLVILAWCLFVCWIGQVSFAQTDCKRQPPFIQQFGFDPTKTAFSTAENHIMGIVLIEVDLKTGKRGKNFQHPSWRKAGYMSGIAVDEMGNVYAVPAPMVNILYNPPEEQNWVYKIDATTGVMDRFVALPAAAQPTVQNPYGTLGIVYDCDTKTLFVTSILGSTQTEEKGRIFAIHTPSKQVSIIADGLDAMGIGVATIAGKRWLVYGKTRSSDICAIALDSNNKVLDKQPVLWCDLNDLGPRGDDRARKIRFVNGLLQINGTSFYYNLTAPTEKPETLYSFTYDASQQKWRLLRYE